LDLKKRARQLKTDIPAVFLSLKSPETPWYARLLAGLTLIYALSPIDLIPDFIPILGYLDDLIILPALIALTIHFIPRETFERYRQEAQGIWQDGKPKKWYFAIPFILIWMFVLLLIIKSLFLKA
jgi:uncharacterized membrane protein YkvA (DUF1232 family)